MILRVLVSIALGLSLSTASRAATESPLVRAGVAAYESMKYTRAVGLLERARKGTLTDEERIIALRTLASAEVALGHEQAAQADLEELLRLAPDFSFDRTTSPKIRLLFEEARARAQEAHPPPESPQPTGAPPAAPPVAPPAAPPPVVPLRAAPAAPVVVVASAATAHPAAPPRPVPLYRRRWFWGIIGGVAAAGIIVGVTVGVLTHNADGRLILVPR